ncbi:Vegetative incompatibility HET-E-1 [Hyphodiscus hymeniophilus]|uniref:Vegetative incompatibility HET-E-1 n=1 Tax=Hyphodiscus hymeniophilus TaxID=353542 RepID=A0A9P6VFI6_9HELO|nr:Vegetative incompatibility HET-E-1 [Hyphodiscus hymeniophilus]
MFSSSHGPLRQKGPVPDKAPRADTTQSHTYRRRSHAAIAVAKGCVACDKLQDALQGSIDIDPLLLVDWTRDSAWPGEHCIYDPAKPPHPNMDRYWPLESSCSSVDLKYKDNTATSYVILKPRNLEHEAFARRGAFTRKDHFRDHLWEYHKEDIGSMSRDRTKLGEKECLKTRQPSATARIMDSRWWRCPQCLARINIAKSIDDWRNFRRCPACSSARSNLDIDMQTRGYFGWILECDEYETWYFDQAGGCLWISGGPGTGKTTALAEISCYLEAQREPGEYIITCFLDPDVKGVNPSVAILGHIITKLLGRKPVDDSHKILEEKIEELMCARKSISTSAMTTIESAIRHSLGKHENLCIIIDGLDEYSQNVQDQTMLLQLVEQLSRPNTDHRIRCIASTRDVNVFEKRSFEGGKHVDLNAHTSHRVSLQRYVVDRLPCSTPGSKSEASKVLAECIARKAAGTFLWAHLVLEELRNGTHCIEENYYPDEIMSIIARWPSKLETLYAEMFGRIEKCHQNAALSMIRWVTFAAQPLHMQKLLGALYIESGLRDVQANITVMSGGLLLIEKDGLVRLVHSSLRAYLQTRMNQNWTDISNEAHEMMAHACLRGLTREALLQSLELIPRAHPRVSSTLYENTSQPHDFVQYAQAHWMFHYRLAEASSTFLAGLLHNSLEVNLGTTGDQLPGKREQAAYDTGQIESNDRVDLIDPQISGIMVAARFGFPKLAKLELEMGADASIRCGSEAVTPLIWAAMHGNNEVVELLIEYGANVEIATQSNDTALASAIVNGNIETAKLLLETRKTSTEYLVVRPTFVSSCVICGEPDIAFEFQKSQGKETCSQILTLEWQTAIIPWKPRQTSQNTKKCKPPDAGPAIRPASTLCLPSILFGHQERTCAEL